MIQKSFYHFNTQVEVIPWISSKHNMGFAFNRSTWRDVVRCANHFCTYDDYNWDWSLQHVSQQCLQKKLHAMVVKGPRVFHIGEWFVLFFFFSIFFDQIPSGYFPTFFFSLYFLILAVCIIRKRIVNRIRSFQKFSKFFELQPNHINCIQRL